MTAITTDDAAWWLGITKGGVRKALKRKRLTGQKYGRDWLIEPEAILKYGSKCLGQPGRKGKKK